MKIKITSRKMGKKISQYCLILALVITGLTTLNVNAEEKIFTEDGYFTEEEIKEVNQMDTISMAPINATPSYGGDGANQQKPQISTFSIQPLAFEKQGFEESAGINYVIVCFFVWRNNLKTCIFQSFCHIFGFVLVNLATECIKCCFHIASS